MVGSYCCSGNRDGGPQSNTSVVPVLKQSHHRIGPLVGSCKDDSLLVGHDRIDYRIIQRCGIKLLLILLFGLKGKKSKNEFLTAGIP
jgi:hypothetical protein